MILDDIKTRIRNLSSIGYLDVDALETYDVENQEIFFQSILYVKDKKEDIYRGYIVIFNNIIGARLHEYYTCKTINVKGKFLLADNINKLIDKITNQ